MKCPVWFPFLGWSPMPAEVRVELGLPASKKWEVFLFDWFNCAFIFTYRGDKK